jgi:hypothetical protein
VLAQRRHGDGTEMAQRRQAKEARRWRRGGTKMALSQSRDCAESTHRRHGDGVELAQRWRRGGTEMALS